ncbi:MAG: tetratricopeptide repeat protein [Dysgonamonadaceae bacterium]|nr:tetratricopeptide repeat protein [Dysgonamonadaceae bacterium]MDD3309810.1 tetratricopeptide repeat protein [Dysgonamonadaceae bacterium]
MRFILCLIFILSCFHISSQETSEYSRLVQKTADFLERDQLDSAEQSLYQAMKIDPSNANNSVLLLNLGIIQRHLGKYNDAKFSLSASLPNTPDSVLVLHNRASLLCDIGELDSAMKDYSTIISIDPTNIEAYYRRGILHLDNNDRAAAESDFSHVEVIDPQNMFSKLSKALLYKLDDNWAEAEKVYTELIDSSKDFNNALYLNRAECYVNLNQAFKAAADLRAIEQQQKDNPYFYILRGRVRLDQYDKIAAKADFEYAKNLGYDPVIADEWIKKTD